MIGQKAPPHLGAVKSLTTVLSEIFRRVSQSEDVKNPSTIDKVSGHISGLANSHSAIWSSIFFMVVHFPAIGFLLSVIFRSSKFSATDDADSTTARHIMRLQLKHFSMLVSSVKSSETVATGYEEKRISIESTLLAP